jgi:hypothetical protein
VIAAGGDYVEAETGELRWLEVGALVPLGTWIAMDEIDRVARTGGALGDQPETPPDLESRSDRAGGGE